MTDDERSDRSRLEYLKSAIMEALDSQLDPRRVVFMAQTMEREFPGTAIEFMVMIAVTWTAIDKSRGSTPSWVEPE